MAPKKKRNSGSKANSNSSSGGKPGASALSGPRLQISAENENRLRRLLLNNNSARSVAPVDDNLSKAQKAKKLTAVYEKLSCEGFTNDQIELALSALKEGATFEAALDWLCFNLAGNELPLKFASGNSLQTNAGSVGVIFNSREDWTPSVDTSTEIKEEAPELSVKIKSRWDDDTLDSRQPSQADWIRQYVEQQQEDESTTWEDDALDKGSIEKGGKPPKFNKMIGKENSFSYAVSVLRQASGRGKSRKAGGLITLQLPDQDETFESAEDAQNRVAAFALCHLFPDLPVHLLVTEPYASLVIQWKEGEIFFSQDIKLKLAGELLANMKDSEEDRRAGFVESLLNAHHSGSSTSGDVVDCSLPEKFRKLQVEGNKNSSLAGFDPLDERVDQRKEVESAYLRQEQENNVKMQRYKDMLKTRATLPIAALRGEILQLLKENNVLVICGETGSGKTTQVPQFILDEMIESGCGGQCNIICTQPRRIAAISVAERVSDERCEPPPGSDGSLVGYQVRLDRARNEKTKLLFCTTGILLRKLAGDKNLTGVTHVIVDEVHERSLLGDFLLIVLKNLIEKQSAHRTPKLKVILMSATVDSNLFSTYFGNCPVITAEGRTHPVTAYFLEDIYESINYRLPSDSPAAIRNEISTEERKRVNEDVIDYDLLEDFICHVDETCGEGAILVFLPIIIATNIAETSITIDDVVYVIDCGKHKENRYNPQKKLSSMVEDWISQANARQRRGRAGRVKPGICFCLYTRYRFEKLMRNFQVPEMLRMPLAELCLQIKLLSLGYVKPLLSKVGALEGDEELTPLGHHLAKLPVDVLIGKMMLYGAIFGCFSPVLSISAFLSYKTPFIYPKDERQSVERAKLTLMNDKIDDSSDSDNGDRQSDHVLLMTAYRKWDKILREKGVKAAQQFCNSNFLSSSVMYMIRWGLFCFDFYAVLFFLFERKQVS
ncbi:ATP-dependent RNA helicase DHX36 [Morella rubra]|uniref:RNA helicase n=1 Tax=Morella rubra TaxID=262757 RepID=A0A6A1WPZ4_9ROSI|nr:ATP-dependent RNA helicase DHX36 [Morella rubra]